MRFLLVFVIILCSCNTPWYKLKLENSKLRESSLLLEQENAELRAQLEKAGIRINMTETQLKKIRDAQHARDQELGELKDKLKGTGVEARIENGQAILTLPNQIFFPSGHHELTKEGSKSLETVAKILDDKYQDFRISVEGHTDNDPIVKSKDRYQDNYQLSSERARSVMLFLNKKGIDLNKLQGVFHGPNKPVAPNNSKANKSKNRRVEIVLMK